MASQLDRPNFVFINTDQQRYDSLGCYGSEVARTPNIDRLAAEGVRFERCYTAHPVCMPARATWFTGQYPSHHGVWQNGVPLSKQADTLQHRLGRAGYHTALIGKIHLDNIWQRREKHPSYGFDRLIECEGDPYCFDDYFRWLDEQGLFDPYMEQFKEEGHRRGYVRDLPEEKHMNNWITGHVEEYLERRAGEERPFFLSVGFFDPHHPFDPCEPYASMFDAQDMPMPVFSEEEKRGMVPPARRKRYGDESFCTDTSPDAIRGTIAAYHATISHVDAMVGRIMDALKDSGLAENTVVIYTSDHGELLGDHGMLHKGAFFYECSVRVPLIFRFPDRCGVSGIGQELVSHVDFAPTVAGLAGAAGPKLVQGRTLFDSDLELQGEAERDFVMVEWRDRDVDSDEPYDTARCLIGERYKYVYLHRQPYGELYDLQEDPNELVNLWDAPGHRDIRERMQQALWEHLVESEPCPRREDLF
jgi:arylsulfatase A-like enzyme